MPSYFSWNLINVTMTSKNDENATKDNIVTNCDIINTIRQLKTESNDVNKKLETQIKGMEATIERNNDNLRGEIKDIEDQNRRHAEIIEGRMTGLEK